MNTTAQDLAGRYATLPESIKAQCPRPITDVTPERVRTWLVDVRTACLSAAASTVDLALTVARDGDPQGAESLRTEATELLSFATQVGDLIGYAPRHTPYDLGTRLEPLVWVKDGITGQENPRPSEPDDYGRVDFDDDEGATIATVHIESDPQAIEHVYVMKIDANAPVIIHGPGGEYIGTIQPMWSSGPNSTVTTVRAAPKGEAMSKITVTRLAELRIGDRLISHGGRAYRTPLRVTAELGPIEFGSPVIGVRVESPNPSSGIEWVLYPSQMDGRQMEVERY